MKEKPEEAYEEAKNILKRKFGGHRRQIQSHIEDLRNMSPFEEDNVAENTEKRLLKKENLALSYTDIIRSYEQKRYIHKLDPHKEMEPEGQVCFLPHFPVCRPDKTTTKTRIVFDASAKHNEVSLNDMIAPGPKLQTNLFDVLLRFRRYPVALACDIREMYLQIQIPSEDRSYFRFLWRDLEIDR